jgi:hypothetical protein
VDGIGAVWASAIGEKPTAARNSSAAAKKRVFIKTPLNGIEGVSQLIALWSPLYIENI